MPAEKREQTQRELFSQYGGQLDVDAFMAAILYWHVIAERRVLDVQRSSLVLF